MLDFANIEQYRENNRIEAKLAHGGLPESIWETYSAFANTLGGFILLGVVESSDKSLRATDLPRAEALIARFWELLPSRVSVDLLTEEDVWMQDIGGKRTVVIRVPRARASERPVYIGKDRLSGTYRRGGEGDYKCSSAEVEAMCRDAAPTDGEPLVSLSPDALCAESIALYRTRLGAVNRSLSERETSGLLCHIGALAADGEGKLHPTAAGLLMFGEHEAICSVYPQFSAVFRMGETALSGMDLCRFYFGACDAFQKFDTDMAAALGEALLNAIVNADHHERDGVRVEITEEKAAFSNTGSFRISPEHAPRGGVSDARLPTLADIFGTLHRGHGLGNGLPYIYKVWNARGLPAPVITETFVPDRILFTLYFRPSAEAAVSTAHLAPYRAVVLSYLTEHPRARSSEVAAHLGIGRDMTRALLNALVRDGLIEPFGAASDRAYRLKV